MRQSILLSAMVGVLTTAVPVFGQSYQGQTTILQSEVEVRSGPSKSFFPTSKLHLNDKVLILRESKEAPGWLEIAPPTGSFSWISGNSVKFAKQGDRVGFVEADPARPVAILPGSTLVNQEPNRESMKLTAGTIVEVIDRPLTVNGATWLPIKPHPGEVRYIPTDAVKPTTVVAAKNGPAVWNRTPDGFATDPVLAEADRAREANDMNRARQLYQQVANNSTDPNTKVLALNRLASLQQQGPLTPGQTMSNSQQSRSAFSPTNPPAAPLTGLQQLKAPAWSTYGRLSDTRMTREDGQPIYSLESPPGHVISYITTNPGKSLQAYLGRTVAVYGPIVWRPESAVRMQYIVASHVAVP